MQRYPLFHAKEYFSLQISLNTFIWIQAPFIKVQTEGIGDFLLFMS